MEQRPNRMARVVAKVAALPRPLRRRALSVAFGRAVPFVGTARLQVETLEPEGAVLSVENKRRVQNHIDGVHAAAMALLAETATGFVVGMNLPDDTLPLLKSMHIDYLKRAKGGLRAEASLTLGQRQDIVGSPKGDVLVAFKITDEAGNEPIRTEMVWAWVPKRP